MGVGTGPPIPPGFAGLYDARLYDARLYDVYRRVTDHSSAGRGPALRYTSGEKRPPADVPRLAFRRGR